MLATHVLETLLKLLVTPSKHRSDGGLSDVALGFLDHARGLTAGDKNQIVLGHKELREMHLFPSRFLVESLDINHCRLAMYSLYLARHPLSSFFPTMISALIRSVEGSKDGIGIGFLSRGRPCLSS